MKHLKLFEEFNNSNYRLDLAVPGRKFARGSMGEPVKDIEELEYDGIYWFPVPSGAGYDVPTLGCLGVTGGEGDDSELKWDDGNEFTSWADQDAYPDIAHDLAKISGDTTGEDDEECYIGLEGLCGLFGRKFLCSGDEWITYDEMKTMIATGKVLKFIEDPNLHGHRAGKEYGI